MKTAITLKKYELTGKGDGVIIIEDGSHCVGKSTRLKQSAKEEGGLYIYNGKEKEPWVLDRYLREIQEGLESYDYIFVDRLLLTLYEVGKMEMSQVNDVLDVLLKDVQAIEICHVIKGDECDSRAFRDMDKILKERSIAHETLVVKR